MAPLQEAYVILSIISLPIIMCDLAIEDLPMGNPKKMKLYEGAKTFFEINRLLVCHS
jgi:hypothetical protein